ncbi:CBS domain-containing protein, partial [Pseudomonas sp. 2995-1]|uniref:CBS domain-containing protein n=1 Tax=Pseudomonas sp. 2995-1 TaxID=1712679 RepID=UPI000C633779
DIQNQKQILQKMPSHYAKQCLDRFSIYQLVALLQTMKKSERKELINIIDNGKKELILSQMNVPLNTVGAIMNTDFISTTTDMTIEDVLLLIQSRKDNIPIELFVTNTQNQLVGSIYIDELLKAY